MCSTRARKCAGKTTSRKEAMAEPYVRAMTFACDGDFPVRFNNKVILNYY